MTNATRPEFIVCAQCGLRKKVGRGGPVPTHCSASCRAAAQYERSLANGRYSEQLRAQREATKARRAAAARPCPRCGEQMFPPRKNHCGSDHCRRAFAADRMREWQRRFRQSTGTRYSSRYREREQEYGRQYREANEHWRKRYPERAAAYDAGRRALIEQATTGGPFAPSEVHERDQWTCGLCREPIDPDIAWPHPMSASVDHVVPLSRGGEHALSNVQSAHLGCNCAKGDTTPEEVAGVEPAIADMVSGP